MGCLGVLLTHLILTIDPKFRSGTSQYTKARTIIKYLWKYSRGICIYMQRLSQMMNGDIRQYLLADLQSLNIIAII